MNRFIETKFFLAIKAASLLCVKTQTLKTEYDEFVKFLFSEGNAFNNKADYLDSLTNTLTELQWLKQVSEKKYNHLS